MTLGNQELGKNDDVDANKPGNAKVKPTAAQKAKNARVRSIQRNYGPGAKKIYENALKNGKSPAQAQAAVDRAVKKGQIKVRPGADSLSGKGAAKRWYLPSWIRKICHTSGYQNEPWAW